MNIEDRKLVEEIRDNTVETRRIVSGLSSSLIGKSNGTVIDEKGGRLGRLENFVWWLFGGLIACGLWLTSQLILKIAR